MYVTAFEEIRVMTEESCGKLKNVRNEVLTFPAGLVFLPSSLNATLQDREAIAL
jgi:hypothetical protein